MKIIELPKEEFIMDSTQMIEDYGTFRLHEDRGKIKVLVYGSARSQEGSPYKDVQVIEDEDEIIRAIISNKICGEAKQIIEANKEQNKETNRKANDGMDIQNYHNMTKMPGKNENFYVEVDNIINKYGLNQASQKFILEIIKSGGHYETSTPAPCLLELFNNADKELRTAVLRYYARREGFDFEELHIMTTDTGIKVDFKTKVVLRKLTAGDTTLTEQEREDTIKEMEERKSFLNSLKESFASFIAASSETAKKIRDTVAGIFHNDKKAEEPKQQEKSHEERRAEEDKSLLVAFAEAHKKSLANTDDKEEFQKNETRALSIYRILKSRKDFDLTLIPGEIRNHYETILQSQMSTEQQEETERQSAPTIDEQPEIKETTQNTAATASTNNIIDFDEFSRKAIAETRDPVTAQYWINMRLSDPQKKTLYALYTDQLKEDDISTEDFEKYVLLLNEIATGQFVLPDYGDIQKRLVEAELAGNKQTYDICKKILDIITKRHNRDIDDNKKTL